MTDLFGNIPREGLFLLFGHAMIVVLITITIGKEHIIMVRDFGKIEQATRKGQKARISLVGLSGSGKSYTALEMAQIITDNGKVVVVDTENRSANLYADMFPGWQFDIFNWEPPFHPRELTQFIKSQEAEYDAIIIDSFSAFWNGEGGLLSIVDGARKGSDSTSGWKIATPIQEEVIQAILRSKCHMFVNVRAKAGIELDKVNGKTVVRKVPMQVVQRDNLIYEMTISANIDVDSHALTIEKTRFSDIADQTYTIGQKRKELATKIFDWLNSAEAEVANEEMISEVEAGLDVNSDAAPKVARAKTPTAAPKAAKSDDVGDGPISEDEMETLIEMFSKFPEDERDTAKVKFLTEAGISHPKDLRKSELAKTTSLIESWLVKINS